MTCNRRQSFQKLAAFLAASPLATAQRGIEYHPEHMPTLDQLVNVFEFEPLCRFRIPKQNYDYISGGVDNEWSLKRNRDAFDRILLRPRMLVDTSGLDLSIDLFGDRIGMPIIIAPTAGHQMATPEGEVATAKAAAAANTLICLSSNASLPLEKVAEATTAPKWWQLYATGDQEATLERVRRAIDAGYKAIAFTVDGPYNSHRERLLRDQMRAGAAATPPAGPRSGQRRAQAPPHKYRLQQTLTASLDWKFLDKLVAFSKKPVLVKGILVPEDAELAVKHGAAGIVVSNHGARYLDYAPSTIEVLPEIMQAVGTRIPVLVDSGFRRGTDIIKALAMGAKAVQIGRPVLWGLGAYGEAGAHKVLQLLESELALAMGLCGKPNVASLDKSLLRFDR